jgi:hypothetical protein
MRKESGQSEHQSRTLTPVSDFPSMSLEYRITLALRGRGNGVRAWGEGRVRHVGPVRRVNQEEFWRPRMRGLLLTSRGFKIFRLDSTGSCDTQCWFRRYDLVPNFLLLLQAKMAESG